MLEKTTAIMLIPLPSDTDKGEVRKGENINRGKHL